MAQQRTGLAGLRRSLAGFPRTPAGLLRQTNFFRWHVIVGLTVPTVVGAIFYACNTSVHVAYIDSLFMATSALTLTGLTTVDVSPLSFGQQLILYILFQLGSIQFISLLTLIVRRAAFNRRFDEKHRFFPTRTNKEIKSDLEAAEVVLAAETETANKDQQGQRKNDSKNSRSNGDEDHPEAQRISHAAVHDDDDQQAGLQRAGKHSSVSHKATAGRGGFPNPLGALYEEGWAQLRKRYKHNNQELEEPLLEGDRRHPVDQAGKQARFLENAGGSFGRNSSLKRATEEAYVRLARLEISAMTVLIYTILAYWISIQLVAVIMWAPYFSAGHFSNTVEQEGSAATSKTWFAIFQSASFLNNCGMSLVDTSLTGFQTCYIMLIPGIFMIVGGNLGYPIGLRSLLYCINKAAPTRSNLRQLTNFALAHPRRIAIYLFPPYETIALCIAIGILTGIDWVAFYVLNIGYQGDAVFSLPGGTAVIDGLVQSAAVRSAGFYIVDLYETAPSLHILYIFMMIFAIYPLALAIRATNVYEEKALGIQDEGEFSMAHGLEHLRQEEGYVNLHLKEQLAYDVWFIILAVWLICIVERPQLESPATSTFGNFSIFDVIFEVCSAYANVGLSIGSPSSNTSTCGSFRHLSKLILCATMIRGRTRGLPIQIDRSIMTPRQLDKHGDPPERPPASSGSSSAGGKSKPVVEADKAAASGRS